MKTKMFTQLTNLGSGNWAKASVFTLALFFVSIFNQAQATVCPATRSMSASNLNAIWVNAGANDRNTFYYGITQSKDYTVAIAGGVGPYTYVWSNSTGQTQQPRATTNSIRIWEPSGPTMVRVTITDNGTGCIYKDSLYMNWTDKYLCCPQKIGNDFNYKLCRNYKTVCVTGFNTMRAMIQAGTHTLGGCTVCAASTSFTLAGLNKGWADAGANNSNVFYHGLTQWKLITTNTHGGVGPYSYVWSNSAGYQLKPGNNPSQINLFEPLGPTWVKATITDIGAGCTFIDSVYVGWSDAYSCQLPNTPVSFKVCINGVNSCVPWTKANRDLVFNGTYLLGWCTPKTDLPNQSTSFSVYPNPSSGLFTLEMPIAANSKGSVEVMDVNGRALYSESVDLAEGVLYHTLDLTALPNGIYIVRVSTDNEFATERIQIIK